MGAKKAGEQGVRSLTKNSTGTYQVSLPINTVRELGWTEGQKVTVTKRGKTLVIADWKE